MEVQPCLKWVGGKSQIIDQIFDRFPQRINNYYEPFVGGGSVFIELLNRMQKGTIVARRLFLNDKNKGLINTYKCIQSNIESLMSRLKKMNASYQKSPMVAYDSREMVVPSNLETSIKKGKVYVYYYYRNLYNRWLLGKFTGENVDAAAMFIFLNKTCFRGLYREGRNGFNVSFGNYENPTIYDQECLTILNKSLNKYYVRFYCEDFQQFCKRIQHPTDFTYIDPPYYGTFDEYQEGGFSESDHKKVLEICKTGIRFLQSNSWTPWILRNYKTFTKVKILCKRRINAKTPQDTDYEILIIGR